MTNNYATNVAARLNLHKFKDVEFNTQDLIIPSINSVFPTTAGPRIDTQHPPQLIKYDPFELTYLLTEDLSNYRTLVDWMQDSITQPGSNVFSDASLFILSTSKTVVSQITFYGMFPTALSSVKYTTTSTGIVYQKATVMFKYLYYKFT